MSESTLLVDVSSDGNVFSYKYLVKGIPSSIVNKQLWQDAMQEKIKESYCLDDAKVEMFRKLFPGGAVYNYYLNDKLVYRYKSSLSICN